MFREGGLRSYWRGNGINVLKIGPETALKFMAYEQVKRAIKGQDNRELSIYERFVAGSIAGGVSQSAIYPLEVLKTRLALRKTGEFDAGVLDAARKIYRQAGLRSFYRGYVPNLIGILPYAGIDLAVYETLKNNYLRTHAKDEQPAIWLLILCGTVSSTAGQVCSYPLALVRTRLQAQVVQVDQANSLASIFSDIFRREGIRGLYRGLTPNFLKVRITNTLTLTPTPLAALYLCLLLVPTYTYLSSLTFLSSQVAPAVSTSYVVYEYVRSALGVNMT